MFHSGKFVLTWECMAPTSLCFQLFSTSAILVAVCQIEEITEDFTLKETTHCDWWCWSSCVFVIKLCEARLTWGLKKTKMFYISLTLSNTGYTSYILVIQHWLLLECVAFFKTTLRSLVADSSMQMDPLFFAGDR